MARARQPKRRTFVIDPHSVEVEHSYGRGGFTLKFLGGTWEKPRVVTVKMDSDNWIGEIASRLHTILTKKEQCIKDQRAVMDGKS
jgi:hypothetical protein